MAVKNGSITLTHFWHVDCVRKTGLKAFTVRYEAFCRKHHYIYQPSKPEELFNASKELVAVFPKGRPISF